MFAGPIHEFEDTRADYGETRIITVGLLFGRMVIVGWTQRGADRHVFTMRKANAREQTRFAPLLR
ncbi:MAG: BrnT family toxin [Methylorubrum rhodinum]|uniref:BrnT family toxin n=1 Tax=Methylorubrum rhodinum TaxID=29428 RepID=UPI003BB0DC3C